MSGQEREARPKVPTEANHPAGASLFIWEVISAPHDEEWNNAEAETMDYRQSAESARAEAESWFKSDKTFDATECNDTWAERQVKASLGIPSQKTPVYDRERIKWVPRRYHHPDTREWSADDREQKLLVLNRHKGLWVPTGYRIEQREVKP